ncbi:hypothetical protein LEP1GSC062_2202 [Leptospira alexanderi serovar Manhao 3 str. L 60]|uniref:Uncharacterized protein n=1 Tax=Leptospira alexanderi serovar Manhao 3 str. L 60 TaxID=1049759 RepID=V6HYD0_9LEPT|nr:hypothetical protein LEP1GSC062_2202 [Leptospira alexanderi serovar Manhao 3 str. L 60]
MPIEFTWENFLRRKITFEEKKIKKNKELFYQSSIFWRQKHVFIHRSFFHNLKQGKKRHYISFHKL